MRCILVAGLEGSGTSCVAGVLQNLGIHMGNKVYGPTRSNPKGDRGDWYFHRLVHGGDAQTSTEWARIRMSEGHDLWGAKSPQMHVHYPKAVEGINRMDSSVDIRFVMVHRSAQSIMDSNYAKRLPANPDRKHIESSVRRGVSKLKDVEKFGFPFLPVDYDKLIESPQSSVLNIADFCYSKLVITPNNDQIQDAVEFVDPSLRHWK